MSTVSEFVSDCTGWYLCVFLSVSLLVRLVKSVFLKPGPVDPYYLRYKLNISLNLQGYKKASLQLFAVLII